MIVDLLKGYKDLELKINILSKQIRVLEDVKKMKDVVENEEDRIYGESIGGVSWDSELIIGGLKIADEKIFNIIGLSNEQKVMSEYEVNMRIKKLKARVEMLDRLLKFIDDLIDSLGVKDVFILRKFYIDGLSCIEISEQISEKWIGVGVRAVELRKKKLLKILQKKYDEIVLCRN